MRVSILIAVATICAGCDRWQSCDGSLAWAIPVWRVYDSGPTNEGAEAQAIVAPDRSLVIVFTEPFGRVQYGDTVLDQRPYLSRVGTDGTIVALEAADRSAGASAIGIDDQGRPVTATEDGAGYRLDGYDPQLHIRWETRVPRISTITVGANGDVAYVEPGGSPSAASVLHDLDASGVQQWQRDLDGYPAAVRFTPSRDVVVVFDDKIRRHAAADGAVVSEVPLCAVGVALYPFPPVALPDGGVIVTDVTRGIVERCDASGASIWRRQFSDHLVASVLETVDGDLVATTSESAGLGSANARVVRLDAATGAVRSEVAMCPEYGRVVGGDDAGFVSLGLPGGPSPGLARFAWAR
ncbi:MAG: hypothetical protein K8W52_44640 [Deltaproteobacteria bacterium]|nr:hypothetical protein [Deltaproteobacteria bacterium]